MPRPRLRWLAVAFDVPLRWDANTAATRALFDAAQPMVERANAAAGSRFVGWQSHELYPLMRTEEAMVLASYRATLISVVALPLLLYLFVGASAHLAALATAGVLYVALLATAAMAWPS